MTSNIIKLDIGATTKRSRFKPLPVELDWNTLPDNAQAFVISYGLRQYLADGMAGAESEAEAHGNVKARVEKLLKGDLSRARGDGPKKPDTVEGRALSLAKDFIRAELKKVEAKADKETIAAAAAELIKAEDKWTREAKRQLENEAGLKSAEPNEAVKNVLAGILAKAGGNAA